MQDIPILEFDTDRKAIIEPVVLLERMDLPEHCVMLIYGSMIEKLKADCRLEKVFRLSVEARLSL